jgi:hypothetical protein
MHLQSLILAHRGNCLSICYEDLRDPETYHELSRFLETSRFNYQSHIGKVKDPANKTDPTAVLIRQRIEFLKPQIAALTCEARAAYGYSALADSQLRPTAG